MLLAPDEPKLSGLEKAAVLMLCLQGDEGRGNALISRMTEEEVQMIVRAVATLGLIPASTVENVIREFAETMVAGAGVMGSAEEARRLLSGLLEPERIDALMADLRGSRSERSIWEGFNALSEEVIVGYLRDEHPQTIAAILSRIRPDVAARTLPLFEPDQMADIALRMMRLQPLPRHVLEHIETIMAQDFLPAASRKGGQDLHQRMADIFNKMETGIFDTLAQTLTERAPEIFGKIKSKMFTFEDLARLDRNSLARLLRGVDMRQLTLALRGVKKPVREAFLGALPGRTRDMVLEEMQLVPMVPLKEARRAQAEIIDLAHELAQQEQIRLPSDDEQLVS